MSKRGEIFQQVEMQRLPHNVFDLSYDHKTSFNMGYLIPVHVQECIPGDKFQMSSVDFLRMAPQIAPTMHNVNVFKHAFFIPNRLVWDGWEDFITGNVPEDERPAFPYLAVGGTAPAVSSLSDYLGLPTDGNAFGNVSAMVHAGYQFVWNDYFRDQNLQAEIDYKLADGDNSANGAVLGTLRKRAWQHDYFTSALPWAQKGDPVEIPLSSGIAPIKVNTFGTAYTSDTDWTAAGTYMPSSSASSVGIEAENMGSASPSAGYMFADLAASTGGITINELRNSIALQTWLETNARGGTRYFESLQAHFNVRNPDSRLQRPEFIGSTVSPMVISEVLQTSSTDAETPQGNMAGHGVSLGKGQSFHYYTPEHGFIIVLMSVMPTTAYQQGIPKHFLKFDPFLYYWKEFANIGEQPILNKELYCSNDGLNDETFGYTPRYAEYRYNPSRVSGEFRTTLNFWHMGRIFTARPSLNSSFIQSDPTTRIFAVTDPDVDHIYAHIFLQIKAKRCIPRFGVPSFNF